MNFKKVSSVFLSFLGLTAPAFASDLTNDLRTPFAPISNPFAQVQAVALPSLAAQELKVILQSCVYSPMRSNGSIPVIEEAALRSGCESAVAVSWETGKDGSALIGHMATVRTAHFQLQVVSWDGSNSDGGDEQALGVYDLSGQRVAVYPSLFVEGNVLDGLARAVAAPLTKFER